MTEEFKQLADELAAETAQYGRDFVAAIERALTVKDAEIAALKEKVKRQAEALRPFAELAAHFTQQPDEGWIWRGEKPLEITVGDLRRAAQEASE